MPSASVRQRRLQVARNSWQETFQNGLNTWNGAVAVAEAPPGLNGVLWKDDYNTSALSAKQQRAVRPNEGFAVPGQLNYNLLGQDQMFGGAGQVPGLAEEPRYRAQRKERLNEVWTWPPVDPILTGQDAIYQGAGQVPIFVSTEPRYRRLDRERLLQWWACPSVDPLLTGQDRIYGGPGQVPVFVEEPKRRFLPFERLHMDWRWNSQNNVLVGQDAFYGAAGEVPIFALEPKRRQLIREQLLPVWVWSPIDPLLTGADAMTVGAQQTTPRFRSLRNELLLQHHIVQGAVNLVLLSADAMVTGAINTEPRFRPMRREVPPIWQWPAIDPLLTGADVMVVGAQSYPALFLVRRNTAPAVQDAMNLQNTTLVVVEAGIPDGRNELPSILVYKGRLNAGAINPYNILAGQDALYGDPGQVVGNATEPRYRALRREALLQSWSWPAVDPVLTGADAMNTGAINTEPRFRFLRREVLLQDLVLQGLVNTVLLSADALPVGEAMLEPRYRMMRREVLLQDWHWADLNDVLLGADVITNGQQNTEPRQRSLRRERLLQHWQWPSVDPVLTGQDQFYGDPGQGRVFVLEPPYRGLRYLETVLAVNLANSLFGEVVTLPNGMAVYQAVLPRQRLLVPEFILQAQVNGVLLVVVTGPPVGSLLQLGVGL